MALSSSRSAAGLGTCSSRQQALRAGSSRLVCRSRILHGDHGHGDHKVLWYKKQADLWQELSSAAELRAAQESLPAGKLLVVDYYAGWCAVCKTAYPAMCRIADDKTLQKSFVFAKASLDNAEVKDWVKREGIKGIPHLAIYQSSGNKLLGMGASFKKAEPIRANLATLAEHKDAVAAHSDGQLELDLDFHIILPGVTSNANVAA